MGVLGSCFLDDSLANKNDFSLSFFSYDTGVHAIYGSID